MNYWLLNNWLGKWLDRLEAESMDQNFMEKIALLKNIILMHYYFSNKRLCLKVLLGPVFIGKKGFTVIKIFRNF